MFPNSFNSPNSFLEQSVRTGFFNRVFSYNLPHMLNLVLFFVSSYYRLRAFLALPDRVDAASNEYIDLRSPHSLARTATEINAL